MGISGVSQNISADFSMPSSNGSNAKIKSLEQKLQQLYGEKEKAAQSNDEEKEKKIDNQIKEIQRQIEQLKNQSSKKEEDDKKGEEDNKKELSKDPSLGKYVDEVL